MRHAKHKYKLGVTPSHRKSMIRNLAIEVIDHGKIIEIREGLNTSGFVWRKHSGFARMGEPSTAVAAKTGGQGWCWVVPVHPAVDGRVSVISLLALWSQAIG